MTYTTNQLISGAYYAAGVVSREFETVSGSQLSDALGWLNDILTEKRVDEGMVPYETTFTFTVNPGQEIYFIPNLIQIDTLVFYLDQVRYAMAYDKRNQYFGMPRVQNVNTLPYNWYFERVTGGGNLYIYFFPDREYPMELHGIFGLNSVELGQNLSANETIADLGVPQFFGPTQEENATIYVSGTLAPGQLVVNSIDLAGNYPDIGSLVNYINTGIIPNNLAIIPSEQPIIPGVKARIDVNDFILYSDQTKNSPTPITVSTTGFGVNGTTFIGPVYAATTTNLSATYNNDILGEGATLTSTINEVFDIDGAFPPVGTRVLIKDQTSSFQNGSYIVTDAGSGATPWILTRTTNYDQPVEIGVGTLFTVQNGFVNVLKTFVQTQVVTLVGTSPILFAEFFGLTFSEFSTIGEPNNQVFNPNGFDQFYLTYLRYALADRICSEYNYITPPNVLRQLAKYEAWINKKSRLLDLRLTKQSTLQKRTVYNWAFINLGRGWISNS